MECGGPFSPSSHLHVWLFDSYRLIPHRFSVSTRFPLTAAADVHSYLTHFLFPLSYGLPPAIRAVLVLTPLPSMTMNSDSAHWCSHLCLFLLIFLCSTFHAGRRFVSVLCIFDRPEDSVKLSTVVSLLWHSVSHRFIFHALSFAVSSFFIYSHLIFSLFSWHSSQLLD